MKNLSIWAKNHPRASQFLITVGHILTVYLSIQVGILLLTMGIEINKSLAIVLLELFILVVWFYPSKKELNPSQNYYKKRRYFDASLLALSVFLTIICANTMTSQALDSDLALSENAHLNVAPASHTATFAIYQSSKTLDTELSKSRISAEKQGKSHNWLQKRLIKKYNLLSSDSSSDGKKVLLMILLVLGIILLEWSLLALSCAIACNGMQAVAAVVILGGLFGLAALTSLALRSIYPDWSKKERIGIATIMVLAPPVIAFLVSAVRN
jgi:hypothetical protein